MMPMMLNYSFTSFAGLNLIMPITDRESKLRHSIHLTGIKSFGYYAGMFVADLTLFLMPLIPQNSILYIKTWGGGEGNLYIQYFIA